MLLLLVDDDPELLDSLGLVLELSGHIVVKAHNGEEAWDTFSESPGLFDAILTDINMPYLDGIELLNRIRNHEYDVPVVVITGHGDLDLCLQALKLSAYD